MTAHFVSSCIGNDGGGGLNIKPDTASGGYGDNNVSDLINQLETGGLATQVNSAGQNEPPSNFAPGDIVVFVEPNQQLHVAIYLGNNEIAQHSTTDPNGAIESVNWTGLAGVGISADFYEITSPPSNLQQPIPSSAGRHDGGIHGPDVFLVAGAGERGLPDHRFDESRGPYDRPCPAGRQARQRLQCDGAGKPDEL